ncbi:hypothetical protein [Endozoicomonas lisbonensis]|uniref:Uncharacterized protein n=1 Tax=Endozoicomonas lisbonensis TaxID=3120522 RepID=A0ABV2SER6_9GAMM
MQDLSGIWDELLTPEKRRLTELLIHRIDLTANEVTIYYKPDGIEAVTSEFQAIQ